MLDIKFSDTHTAVPFGLSTIQERIDGFPCTNECVGYPVRWFLTFSEGVYFAVQFDQGVSLGLEEVEWPKNSLGNDALNQAELDFDHRPVFLTTIKDVVYKNKASNRSEVLFKMWSRPLVAAEFAEKNIGANWQDRFTVYRESEQFGICEKNSTRLEKFDFHEYLVDSCFHSHWAVRLPLEKHAYYAFGPSWQDHYSIVEHADRFTLVKN